MKQLDELQIARLWHYYSVIQGFTPNRHASAICTRLATMLADRVTSYRAVQLLFYARELESGF